MRSAVLPFLLLALAACESEQPEPIPDETPPVERQTVRPHASNPRYWDLGGSPVLLVGGSKEDNLFQIPDLEEHLDLLTRVGGNYVRNTMSSRDSGNVWPFQRLADGRYDLNKLGEEYFRRFGRLLELASARNIIVQIELWDRFDFAREPWLENPYRPVNNVTYSVEESGLANEYRRHPGQNDNPFFRSIPAHDNNELLLRYQLAQVDRLLEIAFRYPNVLYTIDNETNATAEWGAYWARRIKEKASAAGITVYVTEMWDAWDLRDEQHRRTLDAPDLYDFVDISQNNHNSGQAHWDNLQWVRAYTADMPRPLNNVKIYGADTGQYGTDRDGIERFWRSILGGAASARFHRPPSGLGLDESAQAGIRSARLLQAVFDVYSAQPDVESRLLTERDSNEAYVSAVEGEAYALYFPDGGSVTLDLTRATGSFMIRWLDVLHSAWEAEAPVEGGRPIPLDAPGPGHWVAVVRR